MTMISLLLAHVLMIMHAPAWIVALFHAIYLYRLTSSIYEKAKDYFEENLDQFLTKNQKMVYLNRR